MIRDVKITAVLNGFIVQCGCQTLVFESIFKLGNEIVRYYRDPENVEKEYVKNSINSKDISNAPTPRVETPRVMAEEEVQCDRKMAHPVEFLPDQGKCEASCESLAERPRRR